MRILHVTSDWKWTGSAAPMVELLRAQRANGDEVDLACPSPPVGEELSLLQRASEVGVSPILELERARGVIWWRDRRDTRRLRELVEKREFDVVHTWHTRDHVLAVRAASRRRKAASTQIVRSYPRAEVIPRWPWHRWLFGPATDGLFCVSPLTASRNAAMRNGRPIAGAHGAVDLERFRPGAVAPSVRRALGLEPHHRVVGVVARVQRHRRFDLLLEAMAQLAARDPDARLLVVGRGTHAHEVLTEPATKLGIRERIAFAGYRDADYADALRCCDVFTFLVPGSDGSCRALLEAAASGLPAVATARGALPEIVVSEETGLLVDEHPSALAAAWELLLDDAPRRAAMGAAARRRAETCFGRERLASEVARLYEAVRAQYSF